MKRKMSIELESLGVNGKESVIRISSRNPVFCNERDTIADVAIKIVATEHRRLPVVTRKGEVVGVLTKSDLLGAFLRRENFKQPISAIMNREPILCEAGESVRYVLQKFKISRRGGFPVVEGKKLVGIISERDYVSLICGRSTGTRVSETMTKKPMVAQPGTSVLECLKTMVNTHYRRLPVVSNAAGGELVGIVTSSDMLRYIHYVGYSFGALNVPLESIIIRNVYTMQTDDDISLAADTMVSRRVGGLLVVSNQNKLEGIITERDILEQLS